MVKVKFPMLSAPNDGFDENDLWMGLTPEEVHRQYLEHLQDMKRREALRRFIHWRPEDGSSVN
jgi:hypothetical protein